jgi:hypothetical protein
LGIKNLENDEEVYMNRMQVSFADRVAELRVLFRVNSCTFPSPGEYQITLFPDGEWLAHPRPQEIERRA